MVEHRFVRNVFCQYEQPENRLTHALITALEGERRLLRPFVKWSTRAAAPKDAITVVQQQLPGERVSGDEDVRDGLPDACFTTESGWALLIESKIQAGISLGQLRRHVETAERCGFARPVLLVISVDAPPANFPRRAAHRTWREVYAWFRAHAATSFWAAQFAEYLELFESEMIAIGYGIRGTLTMFDGLHFDDDRPYTWREGKRLIRLLGDELQGRKDLHRIGVDPKGNRRSAITGRGGAGVWDYLPLRLARDASVFTDYPHLTMNIGAESCAASITVPNGVRGGFRSRLKSAGRDGFFELILDIEKRLRPVLHRSSGSRARVYALQRHYRSQRSAGIIDARLEADLRTALPGSRRDAKYQPQWIDAVYELIAKKRSNLQLGFTVRFEYDCEVVRSKRAIGLFADAWIGMAPAIDFALGRGTYAD
ncbi:MAG: hypothetical protein AAGD00_00415 [Planctomycetota bacterium]